MESVTDCWLCRLVIDLSGERCFSQAATVLWKPQEQVRGCWGLLGGDKDQPLTVHFGNFEKKKGKNTSTEVESKLFWGGVRDTGGMDTQQKGGNHNNYEDLSLLLLQDRTMCATHSKSATLLVGIRCCSRLHRGMLRHMDFRSAGWKRQDEYKLETACCNRFGGVLAVPFVGKGKKHPFCEKLQPILLKW